MKRKIVYTTCGQPVAVTYHKEYEDFARFTFSYLKIEKPRLFDALLFSGEMGSCINLMARLETAFKEAVKLNYCYEHGEQTEDGFHLDEIYEAMMEEEIAMETCVYFFFEDDFEDDSE